MLMMCRIRVLGIDTPETKKPAFAYDQIDQARAELKAVAK